MKEKFVTRKTLLMRVIDDNDNKAWEDFIFYYEGFINIVLRKFFLNAEDNADLQQEILVSLWKNLKKYNSEKAKFRTWLTTIIQNAALNKIYKNQQTQKLTNLDVVENLMPENLPEFEKIVQREWESYVSTLAFERIKHLFSENALSCFSLFLDKVSPEDIAAKLDISRDSVYKMRTRVINRLQDEIRVIRLDTEF